MSNVTLSVDSEVLLAARRYAADRNTSVNGLVREFLADIASREDRVKTARKLIIQMSRETQGRIGDITWSRDSLHE